MLASLLASLHGHAGGVWGVALTADGRLLASGSEDGAVRLLEVLGGRLMATLTGQAGPVYGVALKPLWVASPPLGANTALWHLRTLPPGAELRCTHLGLIQVRQDRRADRALSDRGRLQRWRWWACVAPCGGGK